MPGPYYCQGTRYIGFSWGSISIDRIKKQNCTCFSTVTRRKCTSGYTKFEQKNGWQTDKLSVLNDFWSPYDWNQSSTTRRNLFSRYPWNCKLDLLLLVCTGGREEEQGALSASSTTRAAAARNWYWLCSQRSCSAPLITFSIPYHRMQVVILLVLWTSCQLFDCTISKKWFHILELLWIVIRSQHLL